MLTCRDVAESATDYMERKLSLRESLQVRLHLLMCGFCRLYVRQLATTRDLLRRLPRALPSDEDMRSLLGTFRSRTNEDEGERR
jgi:hypothetical protein